MTSRRPGLAETRGKAAALAIAWLVISVVVILLMLLFVLIALLLLNEIRDLT